MLEIEGKESLKGKVCVVSGAGNVALHVIEKLQQIGAIPVSCTDSKGTIYDPRGVDLSLLKELKLERRASLEEYVITHESAQYIPVSEYSENVHAVWDIPCYAAFPCATQNELNETDAHNLITNGCVSVTEGANMPSTPEAIEVFQAAKILFAPGKASNAGGVATSGLEMSQNSLGYSWTAQEVDNKLHNIMLDIHEACVKYGKDEDGYVDYVKGANVAGFVKVADAMLAQGVV